MCLVSVLQAVFGCQNDTLKVCNDTPNFENQDMVLLSAEVKRFDENMLFSTTREVVCQEVVRQGMLLKGAEFFQKSANVSNYTHSIRVSTVIKNH